MFSMKQGRVLHPSDAGSQSTEEEDTETSQENKRQ